MRGEHCVASASRGIRTVHPHMRGEHRLVISSVEVARRFIPTCVGSMRRAALRMGRPSVHPHMRGEHQAGTWTRRKCGGSSPHAWGAFRSYSTALRTIGSSPHAWGACVVVNAPADGPGSSPHAWGACHALLLFVALAVHPHMRGEHPAYSAMMNPYVGSSPHAWGAFE